MTARATPSILPKGFIWFLSYGQDLSVLSVESVVKEEKPEGRGLLVMEGMRK